jgi:hypothetical protein
LLKWISFARSTISLKSRLLTSYSWAMNRAHTACTKVWSRSSTNANLSFDTSILDAHSLQVNFATPHTCFLSERGAVHDISSVRMFVHRHTQAYMRIALELTRVNY